MTTTSPKDDHEYCAAELRRQDRERYICAVLAPPAWRPGLFALYAFNAEIARTAEVVSEPMLGQIRLQWWREVIAEIYEGEPRRHQVVQPLAEAIRRHALSRIRFDTLIDARERDLEPEAPADMVALEDYAERSAAPLLALALEMAGRHDELAVKLAHHGGIAQALTGILRATPHLARRNRLMLPADRIAVHRVRRSAYNALETHDALLKVVAEVHESAEGHLAEARNLSVKLGAGERRLLLPLRIASRKLHRLRRLNYDAFDPRLQAGLLSGDLDLVLAAWRGRF